MPDLQDHDDCPFYIVQNPEGLDTGFYYSIPIDDEGQVDVGNATTEQFLVGPFADEETARWAATSFISDAVTEYLDGEPV